MDWHPAMLYDRSSPSVFLILFLFLTFLECHVLQHRFCGFTMDRDQIIFGDALVRGTERAVQTRHQ